MSGYGVGGTYSVSPVAAFISSLLTPFHEVQFSIAICWGAKAGPGYKTIISPLSSGWEDRASN
jgi:hypothetical protein